MNQTIERFVVLWEVARKSPVRMGISVVCLLTVALLEGISLLSLLPLLVIAFNGETGVAGESGERHFVVEAFEKTLQYFSLTPSLSVFLIIIVALVSMKAVFNLFAQLQVSVAQADVVASYRSELLRRFFAARWEYFVSQPSGYLANAISQESQRAGKLYTSFAEVVASLLQFGVYFYVAIAIAWELTIGAGVAGALMLILLSGLVEKTQLTSKRMTEIMSSFTGRLIDSIQGIKPLKAMGQVGRVEPLLSDDIVGMRDNIARMLFLKKSLVSFQEIIQTVAVAAVIFFAVTYTENTFEVLLVMAALFLRTIENFGRFQKQWQSIAISVVPFNHVKEMIVSATAQAEPVSGAISASLNHGIVLNEVSFKYQDRLVLDRFSLEIPANKFTCVLGPSGVGKSTMLDLAIGMIKPQKGEVLVDGIPLSDFHQEEWRSLIGYVPQEVFLFHDSLMRNVTLGDESISEEQVESALKQTGAWEFVLQMDKGIHSNVGERGGRLSGGQRQRVAIARAIVRKPKLLVLDEATSALDEHTEKEISRQVKSLVPEVTVLAITHRPALVQYADVVVDMGHIKKAS